MKTFRIQRINNKNEYYDIEGHSLNNSRDNTITVIKNSDAVALFPTPHYFALLIKDNNDEK